MTAEGYENWDARQSPAWVACPICEAHVEMPLDFLTPRTMEERHRFVTVIVTPFARRLANACRYAETMRHA